LIILFYFLISPSTGEVAHRAGEGVLFKNTAFFSFCPLTPTLSRKGRGSKCSLKGHWDLSSFDFSWF
jgi:hypothetical protein